jgi:hypothetical protein
VLWRQRLTPIPLPLLAQHTFPCATPAQVAADLAAMHDAGMLHRHVTIASVALNRSGNLATARLMGHPYNVDAGQGCAPLLPLPLPAMASNGGAHLACLPASCSLTPCMAAATTLLHSDAKLTTPSHVCRAIWL